jgi:hypothetical protein
MITEQLGYVEGKGNARTDVVLRFLRRLEVEGPRAEPPEPCAAGAQAGDVVDDWQLQQQRYSYRFLKKRDPEVGFPSESFYIPTFAAVVPLRRLWEEGNQASCDVCLRWNSRGLFVHCAGHQGAERGPDCQLTQSIASSSREQTSLLPTKA